MVDSEIIAKRLAYVDEYYRDLHEVITNITWQQFNTDKIVRRYAERTLHILIEACIDVANHIISYEGYREPVNNKDVFQVLFEEKVIDELLKDKLQKMAQFRNVIVHDYIRVQPEIVYAVIQKHLDDILIFAHMIKGKFL